MVLGLDTLSITEDPQKQITLYDHDMLVKEISDFMTKKFFDALF